MMKRFASVAQKSFGQQIFDFYTIIVVLQSKTDLLCNLFHFINLLYRLFLQQSIFIYHKNLHLFLCSVNKYTIIFPQQQFDFLKQLHYFFKSSWIFSLFLL